MARFLLDTSVLIDLSKRIEPSTTYVRNVLAGEDLCVCAIVLAEFYTGVEMARLGVADDFLGTLRFLEASRRTGFLAGRYRYRFAQRGRTLAVADALITAVAYEWDATILTENLKDFPMDDVVVRSLRGFRSDNADS